MGSRKLPKKRGADSVDGEGGFKSLLWVPAGMGERQMAHMSSLSVRVAMIAFVHFHTEALVACSQPTQVLSTTGSFHSGLQAQEIGLGSPYRFSS